MEMKDDGTLALRLSVLSIETVFINLDLIDNFLSLCYRRMYGK
ncbi:protein of unknown function [Xenorhabdus doucetiae]|uniref:Uncharacterized protein n=1 Tax=Xenorhabdus doucetiae TaxID=351671 RepID=A0A068QVM0_9GAMM|nr:protein of unknown function [Xenorhabdus doucetiae]